MTSLVCHYVSRYSLGNLTSNFEGEWFPGRVVEFGLGARSRGAHNDAPTIESPASQIPPWKESWVKGDKARHKRFTSSTP